MDWGKKMARWHRQKRAEQEEFSGFRSYLWNKHIKRLYRVKKNLSANGPLNRGHYLLLNGYCKNPVDDRLFE